MSDGQGYPSVNPTSRLQIMNNAPNGYAAALNMTTD